MTPQQEGEWAKFRHLRAMFPEAAERGRLIAAHQIANDPDARKRVEDVYGAECCRKMYPEAYESTGRRFGWSRALDAFRRLTPW